MYTLKLYQIGYMPVFEHQTTYLHSTLDISAEPRVQAMSDRVIFPALPFSRGSAKSYTVEIPIYSNSLYSTDQYIQMIMSYRRRKVDFFAYVDLDDHPEVVFGGDEDVRGTNGLMWFKNSGAITNATPSTDRETGQTSISITFFTETYWEPVNRVEYIYRPALLNPDEVNEIPDFIGDLAGFISTYPYMEDILGVERHGKIWTKRNIHNGSTDRDWMLTHTTWDGIVNYRPMSVPAIGRTGSLAVGDSETFEIESSLFSGMARSYYRLALGSGGTAFDSDTFVITIQSNVDAWKYSTTTILIDLDQINAALVAHSLGGIFDYMILYFGDWHIQPGFIMSTGVILPVYPYITYSTEFPGQLLGSHNTITFSETGSHVGASLDYLHIFRRE